jgi:hypothetical protein
MNVWDWVEEYYQQARVRGDRQRLRLSLLHPQAYELRETDPDRALALFEEGRRLAQRLHEPWWVLFFDHWRATALLHFKRDLRNVLDVVVATALEARKPVFAQHPLRLAVFDDLVAAYLYIDPRGHAEAIRSALDYLQTQIAEDGEERYMLIARRRAFALETGKPGEALEWARRSLALADADADRDLALHHTVFTYSSLCRISQRRGDQHGLGEYARAGEAVARQVGHKLELALFLVWQALWLRREGDEETARRRVRQGTALIGRLGMPPTEAYYDALAEYHEAGGAAAVALEVRARQLAELANKGHLAAEAACRVQRCRLLRLLGENVEEEAEAARAAARRLREPGWYLAELERVLGGEPPREPPAVG